MIKSFIFVAMGGALGAVLRYFLTILISSSKFPYAILTANILGSFLIGLAYVYFMEKMNLSPEIKLFVMTGILGALTTFSTFSLDTLLLLQQGSIMRGLVNIFLNVFICLLATWFALLLARSFS